jgi:N-acyl-D-amino-acid deacylase
VSFNMNEQDVRRFMRQPWTMTSSDGSLPHFGVGVPHPRSYGSFPRKIRKYALEDGVIDLPFAIRSMTSLTAAVYRLKDRGQLRPGAYADLVVFDLHAVDDPATYTQPHQLARGMVYVLVNGRFAIDGGQFTGARPGRLLKRDVTTRR